MSKKAFAHRSREPDELSTSEAADALGAHPHTIRNWAAEALSGGQSPLEGRVRRDWCGRFWIKESAVREFWDPRSDPDAWL